MKKWLRRFRGAVGMGLTWAGPGKLPAHHQKPAA
jgi:hypothetical protein